MDNVAPLRARARKEVREKTHGLFLPSEFSVHLLSALRDKGGVFRLTDARRKRCLYIGIFPSPLRLNRITYTSHPATLDLRLTVCFMTHR